MTQNPYDQLSKQLLEELLTPFGTVQRSLEIPGEAKWVDLWFVPQPNNPPPPSPTDLLARIAQTPCLLEPYRNPPSRAEIRSCLLKLLWVQEDLRRKANQQQQTLTDADMPLLWIIATSISQSTLQVFNAKPHPLWEEGIYFLAEGFGTILVSIDSLPVTRKTLILRILGRGEVQRQAIAEVLALAPEDTQRLQMLRILGNWKVALELGEIELDNRELVMAFSQAFLEWEQNTKQQGIQEGMEQGIERGERSLILRQLSRRLGALPADLETQIQALSLAQLEALGEALLDFSGLSDLQTWLSQVR